MITLFLTSFSQKLNALAPYRTLIEKIRQKNFPLVVQGPQGSFLALLLREVQNKISKPFLVVVPTEQEALALQEDLERFQTPTLMFPAWGTLPYREVGTHSPVFGKRVKLLMDLPFLTSGILLTSLRALLHPVPEKSYLLNQSLKLRRGDRIDPVSCAEKLVSFGYVRVPRVTVPGEFALRGEVLDVFLPGYEEAFRLLIDFDRISDIRTFSPETQTTERSLIEVLLYPSREVTWTEDRKEMLKANLLQLPEMKEGIEDLLSSLQEGNPKEGEEVLFPLAFEKPSTLLDYLPLEGIVWLVEYERLYSGWETLKKEYDSLYRKTRMQRLVPRPERILLDFPTWEIEVSRKIQVSLLKPEQPNTSNTVISLRNDPPRSFFGNITFFKEEVSNLSSLGYTVYLFADTEIQAQRLTHLLQGLPLTILPSSISSGFSFSPLKWVVIHENELFGRKKRIPKSIKTVLGKEIDTFVELSPGDFVVHVNYGIGKFLGIRRMKAGGMERDYIQLEYADQEYIYLPIEQVNLVQKYIGNQGNDPRLDKIGGKAWENRKNRVRKSVEDIARSLIELYSRRKTVQGFAFPKDTEWQVEFEASFPYEETEDQLRCIEEVKADMEQPFPMDRLVCGDVGYGKTEIALRAAFKAVLGGKQVALLAPTTILAEQHYENFLERMQKYPISIGMLSRFVERAEQKKIIEQLRQGKLDILIGTHRILQKDVVFRDLGLLIIDEEQRFGVKDKEKLKQLKTNVDCLTLTATPIPRTLHMSLMKIRDMSILKTPPHDRMPIETHIGEFSEEAVARAIRRELERGGQVFYLHNRVETLEQVRSFLQKLVPEAFIGMVHGQMPSEEMEDTMHRFIHGAYQVLVSTTIIENGIDIPNVNTISIDRADMYGISQLYQLRGRVGRSNRLAYAYLFYPADRVLSELAMKRLQIISDHTELGSGFKVALKDLEVRGAGNLLGKEQSGDIGSVGFDLYLQLLDEAIRELEGRKDEGPPEPFLDLEYSGYIPDSYISEAEEKMEVYKKIAAVGTEEEMEAIIAELIDRFGPLPEEVQSLLSLAEIRILCKKMYISSMRERKGVLEVEFARVAKVSIQRLLRLIQESQGRVCLDPKRPHILLIETHQIGLKEKSEYIRDTLSILL
ncbi:MAG: transcription-repair coupling factor [Spirochaetales bacterium]